MPGRLDDQVEAAGGTVTDFSTGLAGPIAQDGGSGERLRSKG
jgi:hypothetical protein